MAATPLYAMRLNDTDKANLKALAELLRLKRSDTIRYIVAKELRTLSEAPTQVQTLATTPKP
jgi:hypothetical protein